MRKANNERYATLHSNPSKVQIMHRYTTSHSNPFKMYKANIMNCTGSCEKSKEYIGILHCIATLSRCTRPTL